MSNLSLILCLEPKKTKIRVCSKIEQDFQVINSVDFPFAFYNETDDKKKNIINEMKKLLLKNKFLHNNKEINKTLVIADNFFDEMEFLENQSQFDIRNLVLNKKIHNKIIDNNKNLSKKENLKYSKYKNAFFKIEDYENNYKKYNMFPEKKDGKTLLVNSYAFNFDKQSKFLELLQYFKKENITFDNFLLNSETIAAIYNTYEKYNIFLNIYEDSVIISKFYNGIIMEIAKVEFNLKNKLLNFINERNIKFCSTKFDLMYKGIISNWKYYSNYSLNNESIKQIIIFLKNEINNIVNKIHEKITNFNDFSLEKYGVTILSGLGTDLIFSSLCDKGFNCRKHHIYYSENPFKNDVILGVLFLNNDYTYAKYNESLHTIKDSAILTNLKIKEKKENLFKRIFHKLFFSKNFKELNNGK